ncbi:MAG: anthranilate synthase component I family protein, partial [Longimicrobiales bacterium]
MDLRPTFDVFRERARDGGIVPVWREILFDVDTAVTAYAKLAEPPFGFLLESVVGGEQWARYTFLGSRPAAAWRMRGTRAESWTPEEGWSAIETDDPLADLDRRLRSRTPVPDPELPRFWGGAVGYFGYDVARQIEDLPDEPEDDLGLPDGIFVFSDIIVAIDNLLGRAKVIASVPLEKEASEADLRSLYDGAGERIDEIIRTLAESPAPEPLELEEEPSGDPDFVSSMSREEYEDGVRRIKEYIRAGDAFQVVLSQRLGVELDAPPLDLYRALRSLNPSPYLYFLELDDLSLVGSSPEIMVRVEDGRITLRPIAGTRPRGRTPEQDRALARELLADEKEAAEHRMLVDLGRNDVGRVSRYGSVQVPELMVVERYSHVMHLVSQVEGDLGEGLSAMDVFRACFPAGT